MIYQSTTAVIVTYNSRHTIEDSLAAAQRSHEKKLLDCVVVDNASTDGTVQFVHKNYSWVKLLRNSQNTGFARGCNLGFQHVTTRYVLFLNPDAVLEPEELCVLIKFMDANVHAGIVGPAIRGSDGFLQQAGVSQTPWTILGSAVGANKLFRNRKLIIPGQAPFKTEWICGAVMLVRSDLFSRLKGFDSRFFLYFDETDLCRRVTRSGADIWAIGESVALHAGGGSRQSQDVAMYGDCIAQHYYQSRFYYLTKHYSWCVAVCVDALEVIILFIRACIRRMAGRSEDVGLRKRLSAPMFRAPAESGSG